VAPRLVPERPVVYEVGRHVLSISLVSEARWTVSVDGNPSSRTFASQVEAWEAGVQEAAVLDAPRPP